MAQGSIQLELWLGYIHFLTWVQVCNRSMLKRIWVFVIPHYFSVETFVHVVALHRHKCTHADYFKLLRVFVYAYICCNGCACKRTLLCWTTFNLWRISIIVHKTQHLMCDSKCYTSFAFACSAYCILQSAERLLYTRFCHDGMLPTHRQTLTQHWCGVCMGVHMAATQNVNVFLDAQHATKPMRHSCSNQ